MELALKYAGVLGVDYRQYSERELDTMWSARQKAHWERTAMLGHLIAMPYKMIRLSSFPFLEDTPPASPPMATPAQLKFFAQMFGK